MPQPAPIGGALAPGLMSYVLFDSSYTRALIDIGYNDAGARLDEIEAFLVGAAGSGDAG